LWTRGYISSGGGTGDLRPSGRSLRLSTRVIAFTLEGDTPVLSAQTRTLLGCLTFLMLGFTACEGATDIPGLIDTSQTWTPAGNPYRLSQNAQVAAGVTLTLAAGVVVEVETSAQFIVFGALSSQGTADAPVTFHYYITPSPGSWTGITFQPGSSGAFTHTAVTDATTGISCDGAALTMSDGCSVSSCTDDGLLVAGASTLNLQDSSFSTNGRDGLHITPSPAVGLIQRCTASGNTRYPVYASASVAGLLGAGNTYTANGQQAIGVACTSANDITTAVAWTAQGIPFDLNARPTKLTLQIGSGGTLTIGQGAILRAGGILVSSGGSLVAHGTQGSPITFTSSAATPAPGNWPGISLDPGSSGDLAWCVMHYGVRGLAINSCNPQIANCTITDSQVDGIMYSGTAGGLVGSCTIMNNVQDGIGIYGAAAPNLGQTGVTGTGSNAIRGNGRHAVHNQSTQAISAQDNYWGTADTGQINTLIYDHTDLSTAGVVTYLPLMGRATPSAGMEATTGYGSAGFISPRTPLSYTVYFENAATGLALPVQDVIVTDDLPAPLDWTTVALVGSSHPANLQFAANPATGHVSAAFVGINLPTNPNPGVRQGWVTFTVMPKLDLTTGTQVANSASVSFDYDTPVSTPTHTYTIDGGPPTSSVTALASVQSNPSFTVHWSGTDDAGGSGIATYSVYVSDNGGAYTAWQSNTTAVSAQFTGAVGHSYAFYAVAVDHVGNVEYPPDTPQATTSVAILRATFPAGIVMVSIPGFPTSADPAVVGFDGTSWYRWNPASTGYIGYGSDPGQYTWLTPSASVPGRGYWAKFAAETTTSLGGNIVPIDQPYTIHLDPGAHSGWIQIGCPFIADCLWRIKDMNVLKVVRNGVSKTVSDAATAGWIGDYAWSFGQNGYELVYDPTVSSAGATDRIKAWSGYWVKANVACDFVVGPPTAGTSALKTKPAVKSSGGWQLRLFATAAQTVPAAAVLGLVGKDESAFAAETPPAITGGVTIASVSDSRQLGVDLRADGADTTWQLDVASAAERAPVALSWPDLSGLPNDVRPVLVDDTAGRRVYLRTTNGYTFTSGAVGVARRLRVELLQPGTGLLSVAGLAAAPIAAGGADISCVLSADAAVSVRVMNIAGVPIRTVCRDRACAAGAVRLQWDGRSDRALPVPSGAYLIEVRAVTDSGQEVRSLVQTHLGR